MIALRQIYTVSCSLLHRMIGISYQNTHLGGSGWLISCGITRKRGGTFMYFPRTAAGHASLVWRNGIKKEVDVCISGLRCKATGLEGDVVGATIQGDITDRGTFARTILDRDGQEYMIL